MGPPTEFKDPAKRPGFLASLREFGLLSQFIQHYFKEAGNPASGPIV
jgi:hypothetical protein